jgi:TonB-linked SusC/RagA family outer membrane protein
MRYFLLLLFCMVSSLGLLAQNDIKGKIVDDKGNAIPFATIQIKATKKTAQSDANGLFTLLNAAADAALIIKAQGYISQDVVAVTTETFVVTLLSAANGNKDIVVVSALGISKNKRAIGYAAQTLTSEKLTTTKIADVNTAIAGKIAGTQISGGSGAKLGGATIRIRGVNTLGGGNPIYVVDGVITNSTGVNPDDVESLTVLKGPAATALYGQRGSEGAVVIVSKRAAKKGLGIDFSHATTFEQVYILPKYQNEYGGGASQNWLTFNYNPTTMPSNLAGLNGAKYYRYDVDESWGPKLDGTLHAPWYAWDASDPEFGKLKPFIAQKNNVKNFFNTGISNNTTIALSKASTDVNTRFSFTNITRTGVMPNSKQTKNWLTFFNNINLTNRLSFNVNANYVYEHLFNVPSEGYGTQTTGSFNQWFHRNIEIEKLKRYKRPDGTFTSWNITSPTNVAPKYWDNPYTEVNENIANTYIQRIYGSATLSYKILPGLKANIITRGNFTNTNSDARTASFTLNQSRYAVAQTKFREVNIVASVDYEKSINDFNFKAAVYGETMKQGNNNQNANTVGGLIVPNTYNINNSTNEKNASNFVSKRQINSTYGYASVGYRNLLFVDVNVRNDVSSTLPSNNNSYLYGGATSSFIFTEILPKNNILTFGKLRASIAKVGTDIGPYNTQESYALGNNYVKPVGTSTVTYLLQTVPNQRPNTNLKPTLSTSYEVGTELQFFGNKFRADFNYYFRESKGQIIPIAVPGTTGYTSQLINAGNIRNFGYEVTLGATPIRNKNMSLGLDFNLGVNRNKVVALAGDIDNLQAQLDGSQVTFGFVGSPTVSLNAKLGKPYGQIIGKGILKDANGNKLVDNDGYYLTDDNMELGNVLPDFTGGFATQFTYKNFFLNASLDFQKGGRFISTTKMFNSGSGLAFETVGLNDKGKPVRDDVASGGGVKLPGVNINTGKANDVYLDAKDAYQGHLFSLWERWIYDASYVKLREVNIGYNIPKTAFKKLPFQGMSVSLVGQNLWLIASKVKGIDPSELEQSWIEGGQLPGTRTVGVTLKLTF